MAKKKTRFKLKLNKRQKAMAWTIAVPTAAALIFLFVGIVGTRLIDGNTRPRNIVWAADKTVTVPSDLKSFLLKQDKCQNYRGKDTPTGVGLWGVFQMSQGKYAKIAYGCSWNLTNYIMVVKDKDGWKLLDPSAYFAPFASTTSTGVIPLCKVLDQYKIDKSIESFCIDASGTAKVNTN
jgi:hypothetical protein